MNQRKRPDITKQMERYHELDIQGLVALCAEVCETKFACLSLRRGEEDYIKAQVGIPENEVWPKGVSLFASVPIISGGDFIVGTLSVMDTRRGRVVPKQIETMELLSRQIVRILEMERIKEVKTQQRAFFESSSGIHLLLDTDIKVLDYNKTCAAFFKSVSGIEIYRGAYMLDLLRPQTRELFYLSCKKALLGNRVRMEQEIEYDEESIFLEVCYDPVRDSDQRIIGLLINASNISQHKAQEQVIIQQNESLREIAHIQSHELRGPLVSILGLVELLKAGDTDLPECLGMLEQAAGDLDEKIRYAIKLAKI
nr:hypothetical protein [Pedobacter sp. ASV19]